MPERARPLARSSAGLLRLHARAAGVAVLLAALSTMSFGTAAYAKPAKASKTASAKPATGKTSKTGTAGASYGIGFTAR